MLLVVEVLSRGSEVVDRIIKKAEYAAARIPRYWIVERDNSTAVRQYALNTDTGGYQLSPAEKRSLDHLLTGVPDISRPGERLDGQRHTRAVVGRSMGDRMSRRGVFWRLIECRTRSWSVPSNAWLTGPLPACIGAGAAEFDVE
ncbi:Uma2 family endonuclease [Actinoplanes sp. GCM10030250]|uniref:Uma2 family endonuclease n=1 Tax=Actinoplanes sp. GCM10030250 TaxID=3273376 RepID=UPI00360724F3